MNEQFDFQTIADERTFLRSLRRSLRDAETRERICEILAKYELAESEISYSSVRDEVVAEKRRLAVLEAASASYRRHGDAQDSPPWAMTEECLAREWLGASIEAKIVERELIGSLLAIAQGTSLPYMERYLTIPERVAEPSSFDRLDLAEIEQMWFELFRLRHEQANQRSNNGVVSDFFYCEGKNFISEADAAEFMELFATYFIPIGIEVRTLQGEYLPKFQLDRENIFEVHGKPRENEIDGLEFNYVDTLAKSLDTLVGENHAFFASLADQKQLKLSDKTIDNSAEIDLANDSITIFLSNPNRQWLPYDLVVCGRALAHITFWRNRLASYSWQKNTLIELSIGEAMRYLALPHYAEFYGDGADVICDLDLSFTVLDVLNEMALSEFELWLDQHWAERQDWLEKWRTIRSKWLPLDTAELSDETLRYILFSSRTVCHPGASIVLPLVFATVMASSPFNYKATSLAHRAHKLLTLASSIPLLQRFADAEMPLATDLTLIRRASYAVATRLGL